LISIRRFDKYRISLPHIKERHREHSALVTKKYRSDRYVRNKEHNEDGEERAPPEPYDRSAKHHHHRLIEEQKMRNKKPPFKKGGKD